MPKNIVVIEAGPGSGKTTTLTATHNYLLSGFIGGIAPTQEQYIIMETVRQKIGNIQAQEAVFACMTNSGKENLTNRIPSHTKAFTFNGLGASLLIRLTKRHPKLDSKRGERILEAVIGQKVEDLEWSRRKLYYSMLRYIKCMKEELLQPCEQSLDFIQLKYGIETPPPEDVGEMVQVMQRMMHLDGTAEYIDQYWLAVQKISSPLYKLGYVDECQDVSALKLLLMMKCCENLVFCGDPWQAINAFAGADFRAFERINALAQTHLTLKTCFRCPPNHVEHFNTIRPARCIAFKKEAVPDEHITIKDLGAYIKSLHATTQPHEHMMISRLNNILLRVGIQLMKQGVAVHLLKSKDHDRSIDTVLTDYIFQTRARSIAELIAVCNVDKKNAASMTFQAGSFAIEKADCIIELAEGMKSIPQLLKRLQTLTEESPGSIAATTIHKAKGLEAKYVYILYPPVQLKPEYQDQIEQEINLEFVSESRSLYKRIYVHQH